MKVLTKTQIHMVCECDLLKREDEEIHSLSSDPDLDLCHNVALVKFEVAGEGIWLCPECVVHNRRNL